MSNTPMSTEKRQQIYALGQQLPHLSNRKIGAQVGCNDATVMKYRDQPPATLPAQLIAEPYVDDAADIRTALRKGPLSAEALADLLDCSPKRIRERIAQAKARGGLFIEHVDGRFDLGAPVLIEPGRQSITGDARAEWSHIFGFVTDNHLCNRHSRLDVLKAAYDHYEREGITTVYNAGNWIDGEARFNKTELVTAPGMDNQLDYLIDQYPLRRGITTHYIAGDDHEGWYQQREGIEVGRWLEVKAEKAGRSDLKYLGYGECDISLKCGSGEAVARLVHPGGGSAYATSYTAQKLVESYQGGEKPQILLIGHYHKFEYGYPREVHCVQGGCTTDQSLFMRKKKIQAHVGFSTVRIRQREDGAIDRFAVEWFPFYDRGFYEKRF